LERRLHVDESIEFIFPEFGTCIVSIQEILILRNSHLNINVHDINGSEKMCVCGCASGRNVHES
jgi:hypothetical protein